MFDLERMGYPMLVEAHGQSGQALYRSQTTDTHHTYIAVPQSCSLTAVPLTERELEGVARRKEREEAKKRD